QPSPKAQQPTSTVGDPAPSSPQTLGTNFTGATLADTGAFPPDSMGDVGPTQYIVAVNGRIRSFNKSTGVADGVLNLDTDVFFSSVKTPLGGTIGLNFTSDPRIRYDRGSGRWFVIMIDVPSTSKASVGDHPNRVMLAVSSGSTISNASIAESFSLHAVPGVCAVCLMLVVDFNALDIGARMSSTSMGLFTS